MEMATGHLLDDFPAVKTTQWEGAIARDLKGADYEKRLIWSTEESFVGKPYYRATDLRGLAMADVAPGEFPYRRGARRTGDWAIREVIEAGDALEANRAACTSLAAGAEAIAFRTPLARNRVELDMVLANLGEIPVHFEDADENLLGLLLERTEKSTARTPISTGFDPFRNLKYATDMLRAAQPTFVPFTIHAGAFEEAGATTVEELGFALAAGVDFLAAMTERGIAAVRATAAIEFSFAIGSRYFFEIAKLRAFRMLWARAAESFGISPERAQAHIAARTSRWNKTVYDPHVNILRTTTEAMAAILGGADVVTVAPFDDCFKEPTEASRRLARNTQLLLKHEASLGRVADPGGGSYLIEVLTDFLAGAAWKTMQEIEARGGYLRAKEDGAIAQVLERSRSSREAMVARRLRAFIGTTQFADPAERALDGMDQERMNSIRRATSAYEKLRMRTEWHAAEGGKTPRVMLAEIGDARMRTARSNFALNFFACAGFAIEVKRFKRAGEIASMEGDLIVLCSSDAEYPAMTEELMQAMKELGKTTPVIIAGNPQNAEQLRAVGVAALVHMRSDPLEVLARWQVRLGIRD
jgi:methylmalonyl-CoA mutase